MLLAITYNIITIVVRPFLIILSCSVHWYSRLFRSVGVGFYMSGIHQLAFQVRSQRLSSTYSIFNYCESAKPDHFTYRVLNILASRTLIHQRRPSENRPMENAVFQSLSCSLIQGILSPYLASVGRNRSETRSGGIWRCLAWKTLVNLIFAFFCKTFGAGGLKQICGSVRYRTY